MQLRNEYNVLLLSAHVQAAVLSGSRDPYQQDPTGFHFQIKDSPVFVDEIGEYPGNYLIYAMANRAVFRTAAGSTQGLDLLSGSDWSPPATNRQIRKLPSVLDTTVPFPRNYAAYLRPYLLFQPVFQYYDAVGANSQVPARPFSVSVSKSITEQGGR